MQTEEIKLTTDPRFIDITGVKYGMLTAVGYAGRRGVSQYWLFRCDCGVEKTIKGSHVKDGRTRSCGCIKAQEQVVGMIFGRWTPLREVERNLGVGRMFECVCECGVQRNVIGTDLINGGSKSCGCLNRELHTTHGMSNTAELKIWNHMIARCYNSNTNCFDNYGGRGIQVCERWRSSFESFLADMGMRPSLEHSIDRFPNNNGNYEPGNCRWATPLQQGRNKRNNRLVTIGDVTKCLSEWSEETGVKASTIARRIDSGVDEQRAIDSATLRVPRRNITGHVFGRWTVIELDADRSVGPRAYWLCRCQCGVVRSVRASKMTSGESTGCKSCGAKRKNGE